MHVLIHYFPSESFFVASLTKHPNLTFLKQQKRWVGLRVEYISAVSPTECSSKEFRLAIVKYFGPYKANCLPFRYAFKADLKLVEQFIEKYVVEEVHF